MNHQILGAIVGDIAGSVYEFHNMKTEDCWSFELFTPQTRFTDDTVMTLAVAQWLTEDALHTPQGLVQCMKTLGNRHPHAGYGGRFRHWLQEAIPQPYYSWGNGSAMRVSPVGLYAKTIDEALALATISASVSHNHPEGIKGAQALATSIFLCRQECSKEEIKEYVQRNFGYNLERHLTDIRPNYSFDVSCQGSVPEAIIAFLEGSTFEEVIRLSISIGGDSDTIACMAGSIAACCYLIPEDIAARCRALLTDDLQTIMDKFL